MHKKNTDEVEKRREELRIRKMCISRLKDTFRLLNTERLALLADYANSLIEIDEDKLQLAEQQAIEICGYNPTADISEHDWAVMQKRNEEALAKEARQASD